MISPERLDIVQIQWARLLEPFAVDLHVGYAIFDRLVAAYQQPHRHYHNLEHLGDVFKVIARLPVQEVAAVRLAVWFHDVVYDPSRADNEAQSAALAGAWLGEELQLSRQLVHRVQQLILATRHGAQPPSDDDGDRLALLDADLAILGASPTRYQRYAAAIRQEYGHVSEAEYRRGRATVLRGFLERDWIFHTRLMREEGEKPARENLRSELNSLADYPSTGQNH